MQEDNRHPVTAAVFDPQEVIAHRNAHFHTAQHTAPVPKCAACHDRTKTTVFPPTMAAAWLDPLTDVAQPVRQSLVVVFRDAQAAALPAAEPAQLEEAGGEGRG